MGDELENRERGFEASMSKLRKEVEDSSRKEMTSNNSNNALPRPSPRDLPIVFICAWQSGAIISPKTVTFESFLANYNNGDRPGGGDGVLDLNSGVFTCITPGYYTVSYSLYGAVGASNGGISLYLYKNGLKLPESHWSFFLDSGALNDDVGSVGSRIVILHLDVGDTLELRMTSGDYIREITLNIELTGLGFDYLV